MNFHTPGEGFALMVLTLTQIPVAVKNAAEVQSIEQTSNRIWKLKKNQPEVNLLAFQKCYGRK